MKPANRILAAQPTTIFTTMSALATAHEAINLGQGFPDGEGPAALRQAAARYVMEGPNQYPPMQGLPRLRQAIAAHDRRFYGLEFDWQNETLVTSGATEALTASFMALLNPGDEAVVIEPVYDSYRPVMEAMGAVVRAVRLDPPAWSLPWDELAASFSDKTKLLVLNSPMNPIGKVFTPAELARLAELVRGFDLYVICDEVYEHLVFEGAAHIPLMTLPGMEARCVRIASAGKTFSLTGWKVGMVTARAPLLETVAKAHQFITFTTPPALQLAVAEGLEQPVESFRHLADSLRRRRDLLAAGLRAIGFEVLPCDGTYFLTADFSRLDFDGSDADFCIHLTTEAGVAAIPVSAFYGESETAPKHLIRFCFCKEEEVLREALSRLHRRFRGRGSPSTLV